MTHIIPFERFGDEKIIKQIFAKKIHYKKNTKQDKASYDETRWGVA